MSIQLVKFLQNSLRSAKSLGLARLSSNVPDTAKQPDPIIANLKTATKVGDVLAAVQTHLPLMTHRHLVHALSCLFQIHKANKNQVTPDVIVKDPAFGVLCQNLNKRARELETGDTIESIKVLSFLGVPADALIVQTLLQMVRCNINQLTAQQIMFLDFLLTQLNGRSHLVDALQLALPLAFQIQLPLELDPQDLPLLREMLVFACRHRLPDRSINNIVTGLLLHDQAISAPMAKSIAWALCQINCTAVVYPTRKRLLDMCCEIMVRHVDDLAYEDVLRTLAKFKLRILDKHPEYYQEEFFDAAADFVVQRKLDFDRSLLVARILSRIAHAHLGLAAHLCAAAAGEPGTLTRARPNLLFAFINYLSNNNYIPGSELWKPLKTQMMANPVLDATTPTLPWTKICLELASLNCYVDRALRTVFSEEFLERYLSREDNVLDYLQLLTLYEAVNTFHDRKYALPAETVARARELYPTHAVTEALAESLARGLPHPDCVITNVMLSNGILANMIVCVHKGSFLQFPSGRRTDKVPIEQLNIPKDATVVCIMNFNQGCYSVNSSRMRGAFRLVLDVLERQGYAPIGINGGEWARAPAHERTPYLVRELEFRLAEVGIKMAAT
ncbi:uncharacterized protein LOC121726347 [Aricia agestis]|uniref:uncharacterized protein LOC121726347 n=1 Tax=Aricia agestis TaxID=91739 RepID=UPI001C2016BC|nr:uncharacterized protein LOC121726347 [Aricia agestis]XP_041969602.1 uncharacterized protein LOC121726347 [Aricia agestis]